MTRIATNTPRVLNARPGSNVGLLNPNMGISKIARKKL
jgi:hypothetical protein